MRLNDIAVDSKGRIYVTHPRYGADEPGSLREPGVYRIDPDGSGDQGHLRCRAAERHRDLPGRTPHHRRQLRLTKRMPIARWRCCATISRRMAPPPTVGCWSTTLLGTAPTVWSATPKATCGWRSEIPIGPAYTPIRWRTGSRRKELTFRPRSSRPTSTSAAAMLRTTCTSRRAAACTGSASANAVTTFKGGRRRPRSRSKARAGASDAAGQTGVRALAQATTRRRLGPPGSHGA